MSTSDLPIGPPSGTFLIKNVAFPTQFMDVPGDTSTPGNKVCGLHNDGTLAQYVSTVPRRIVTAIDRDSDCSGPSPKRAMCTLLPAPGPPPILMLRTPQLCVLESGSRLPGCCAYHNAGSGSCYGQQSTDLQDIWRQWQIPVCSTQPV